MKKTADHSLLDQAKQNKNDEFYTLLPDIERELVHCRDQFRGKCKIVRFRKGDDDRDLSIGGKPTYFRILISKYSCNSIDLKEKHAI